MEELLEEVETDEPEELTSIFGKSSVTVDECFKELHATICKKDSQRLKNILALDVFEEPQYWFLWHFQFDDTLELVYQPVEAACCQPSFECLKILLDPIDCDFSPWPEYYMFHVLAGALDECIYTLEDECVDDTYDWGEIVRCMKYLIARGAPPMNKKGINFPLSFFESSVMCTSDHLKILYTAGKQFEFEDDRAVIEADPSGFLSYLESKLFPKPDKKGLFHADKLQNICRDQLRRRCVDTCWWTNIFCFAEELREDGHLTHTAANFLVYGLHDEVFKDYCTRR